MTIINPLQSFRPGDRITFLSKMREGEVAEVYAIAEAGIYAGPPGVQCNRATWAEYVPQQYVFPCDLQT